MYDKQKVSVKKLFIAIIFIISGYAFGSLESVTAGSAALPTVGDARYIAKVEGRDFYIHADGGWQKKFLKGVNMGVGKPGVFPGEHAISKEEYLRWFQNISDMNADVIRVYTILKPEFYDALHEFNQKAKKPLYLLHGVYLNEELINELEDVYSNDAQIKKEFIADAQTLVDVLHGRAKLPEKFGWPSGEYKSDVSEYVIGWILGIEWDPLFVIRTNQRNSSKRNYSGKFLHTEQASPFEAFLCEVGDKVAAVKPSSLHCASSTGSRAGKTSCNGLVVTTVPDGHEKARQCRAFSFQGQAGCSSPVCHGSSGGQSSPIPVMPRML